MRISSALFTLALLGSSGQGLADDASGEQLFNQHCGACHASSGSTNRMARIAPDMAMVKQHYIGSNPDKDSFVMVVADWVAEPDADKTLMPGAVRRFGVMPKIAVSAEAVEKIAAYVYDEIVITQEMQQHIHRMHGRSGSDNQGSE